MTPETILETVRQVGGMLWAEGERLKYRLPVERPDLIPVLREHKSEILVLLSRPSMPAGVRLIRWEPVQVPVRISECSNVVDVELFIRTTLRQVEARLTGKGWLSGSWTLSTSIDRLAAVGCHVALDDPKVALQ